MTTASAGPSGFHTKHFVTAFVVAGFVAAILVIAQWLGSDSRPVLPQTDQAASEVAASESSVSANWEAFAAGKLDDGPATQSPATATVEAGTSANWINYRDGKFEDTNALPTVEADMSANWINYRDGKFEDTNALPTVEADMSANWINYRDGKFEDTRAQPRTYEPAVAGGHQEF